MSFVYPNFLWALLLVIIPIIIHLYNFRKFKTIYFSSILFLKKIDLESQSTKNLKHLLVLFSRILAIIFAVLAFAQPYIPVSSDQQKGGNPVLAIYLDNSFSMGQKGTEGELISEARESAKRIINNASSDTRFMLTTNEMSGIEQRIVSKSEATDRIDKINLTSLVRKLGDVMDWQRKFILQYDNEKEKISTVQYILLSDFQKNSFDVTSLSEDKSSFYYPIQFVSQNTSNICVDSIWFTEPNIKIGQNNELNIRVRNYGDKDWVNAELTIQAGDIKRDVFIDIPANQSATTSISFMETSTKKDKYRSASASIRDKQVFFDDEFFFSYAPKTNANILIINGEESVSNVELVFGLDNFYAVKSIAQTAVTLDQFDNIDLIVLNGFNAMASGLTQQLKDFKENQGSLLIFPGTKLELSNWNIAMTTLGLSSFQSAISEGTKIRDISYNDAFFKPIFDKKPTNLNTPALTKMYATTASGNSVPLIKSQNERAVFTRSIDSKVFLFTSSLVNSFSSFTSNALFSTLLLRVGELSHKQRPYFLTIGENSKYPLYSIDNSEKPLHLINGTIDFIPIKERIGNTDFLSIRGIEAIEKLKAGIYSIESEKTLGKLALNYSRQESDITPMTMDDVVSKFESKGLKNISPGKISEGQSLAKLEIEKPFEYWRWAILLSVLFLLSEMVLLRLWKN